MNPWISKYDRLLVSIWIGYEWNLLPLSYVHITMAAAPLAVGKIMRLERDRKSII